MTASRKITTAFLAALTFAAAIPASPASACGWGGCGYYYGGWGHRHGYGWGYGGAGLAVGLAAGALAAGAVAASAPPPSCFASRPVYDRWGNYAGQQTVRVC